MLPLVSNWLNEFCLAEAFTAQIAVRINNPALDCTALRHKVAAIADPAVAGHERVLIVLDEGTYNIGFSRAHNTAFQRAHPDFLLIMADDMGLPFLSWLPEAIRQFDADGSLGMIGNSAAARMPAPPGSPPADAQPGDPLSVPEATILLVRSTAFEAIGRLDEGYRWAGGEDSELGMRMRQNGFGIGWIPIAYEHWSGSSFTTLPWFVQSSIRAHNGVRLLDRWDNALAAGRPGQHTILDLWSDGMGDVLCALVHAAAAADEAALTGAPPPFTIINTRHRELARALLPTGSRVETCNDLGEMETLCAGGGIAAIRSIRPIVYAHPFNVHVLLTAALGLPIASDRFVQRLFDGVQNLPEAVCRGLPTSRYAIVHLESVRGNEGRAPAAQLCDGILHAVRQRWDTVVLIGLHQGTPAPILPGLGTVVDLRGALPVEQTMAAICRASAFIGIDSFPSHVAQLAGVPAAILFGAVNPLSRVWSDHLVWPIVAKLDCLGCYHELIEPSVPFCMRRDNACMKTVMETDIVVALTGLLARTPFDWRELRRNLENHQQRFLAMQRTGLLAG